MIWSSRVRTSSPDVAFEMHISGTAILTELNAVPNAASCLPQQGYLLPIYLHETAPCLLVPRASDFPQIHVPRCLLSNPSSDRLGVKCVEIWEDLGPNLLGNRSLG